MLRLFQAQTRLILVITALCLLAGGLYFLLIPPTYKADGEVQVENDKTGSMSQLSDISSLLLGSPVETEAEIQLLQSRLVLDLVIDKMNLLIDARPKHFPIVGFAISRLNEALADEPTNVASPFLGLSSYAWGGEAINVPLLEVPDKWVDEKLELQATGNGGYDMFGPDKEKVLHGQVGVLAEQGAGRTKVRILVSELRSRAGTKFRLKRHYPEDVIKAITDHLSVEEEGKQSGIIGITFTGRSADFVTQVVQSIEDSYLKQNVDRRSADALHSLEFLKEQLPDAKGKVDAAQAALNAYQVAHGSVDVTQETELVLKQSVDLQTQRLSLITQRDEALQRFTGDHPVIVALNKQISSTEQAQARLRGEEERLPKTQQEVFSLSRDLDVATELYTQLLNTIQELEVAKAGTIGNVRIVDDPLRPSKPDQPKILMVVAASLLLGLVLSSGLVLLRNALIRGVEDPSEVEMRLGLTNYGMIPYVKEQRSMWRAAERNEPGAHILAKQDSGNPAVEAIRSLRTSLHFALMESTNNIVMFTGPGPGLGKSFVSINLGAVLAASGKRVAVVDADMRRGQLHRYVGHDSAPGLADYVVGDADLGSIIRSSGIQGLDVISHGQVPPNPAELLMHERFASLLAKLSKDYDYVIVDTPPILLVTDAAIVGRLAGCTLMVLKSAEHTIKEIEEVVRRLGNSGVKVRGTIFNQIGISPGSYGYGTYGYKYYRYED